MQRDEAQLETQQVAPTRHPGATQREPRPTFWRRAPFSEGRAPAGAGFWKAKGLEPNVLCRNRSTEHWGFSRPAGGKSGGAGL